MHNIEFIDNQIKKVCRQQLSKWICGEYMCGTVQSEYRTSSSRDIRAALATWAAAAAEYSIQQPFDSHQLQHIRPSRSIHRPTNILCIHLSILVFLGHAVSFMRQVCEFVSL